LHQVIQSAVNVSTSAKDVVQELVSETSNVEGVKLADYSFDVDHNRSVSTYPYHLQFFDFCFSQEHI